MADIVVTAANVIAGSNATKKHGTAGATITAGQTVYQDADDKKWKLADNNSATAAVREAVGMALNNAAADQPITVQTGGDVTPGATLVAGTTYYQSDTPGGWGPLADVGAGEYVGIIGIAKSTTVLALEFSYPGVSL